MTRLVFDVFDAADPNGTPLGELTDGFAKECRVEFNALGSGRASVNLHDATQAAWLAPGNLVKVRLDDGAYFFAFWLGEGNDVAPSPDEEGGEVLTRGGRGALAYLERAILYPTSTAGGAGSGPQTDGNWLWEDDTYAGILQRLVDEAQSRSPSPLPDLTVTLNTSATIPGEFRLPIGLDMLEVVQRLQSLGLEVRMSPTLDLEASDDLSATPAVTFAAGVNIRDAGNRQIHATPVKSRMIVQGTTKGGVLKFAEVTDADLEDDPQIGRREGFVEYGAATDDEVLLRAGQQALRQLAFQHEGPITIGVTIGDGTETAQGHYVPFVDYRDGDLVTLTIPSVVDDVLRVQAITLRQTETDDTEVILELEGVPFDPVAVAIGGDTTSTGGGGGGGGANTRDCEECPPVKPPPDPFTDCDPFQKFTRAVVTIIGSSFCGAEYTLPVYNFGSGSPPPLGHTGGSALSAMAAGSVVSGTYDSDGTSVGTLSAGDVAMWSAGLGQFLSAPLEVSGTIEFPATGVNNPALADEPSVHGGWGAYAVRHAVVITIGDFSVAFYYSAAYFNIANGGAPHPAGVLGFEIGGGGEYSDGIDIGPDAVTANFAVQIAGGNLRAKIWSTTDPGWQVDTPWAFGAAGDVSLTFGGHPFSESGWDQAVDDFGDGRLGAYTDGTITASMTVAGACAAGSEATNEWGDDQEISDQTGITQVGQADGFAFVEWAPILVPSPVSWIVNRGEVTPPGYLLPTLGAGGTGDLAFTMPFKISENKPGVSDDVTAHVSVRMKITLPGGNVRGVGAYIHDGLEYLEVYDGASWSETGSPSVTKEWNVNQLYILRLDLAQDAATASVTGGPSIALTPLDPWDPGIPPAQGSIDWETSVVGEDLLYGSRVSVGEMQIRSLGPTGVLIPPFWCTVPEQTEVPWTVIGHGDGTTTQFFIPTPYQEGSTEVKVNGQPANATETIPGTGAIVLEFPPGVGDEVSATWAAATTSIPPTSGYDTTGTKVFFPDAPSLATDQGDIIEEFILDQVAAGKVAAFNPGGVYRVDERRFISSVDNLRIWGPGVEFRRVDTSAGMHEVFEFLNCNDGLIQGLTIRGPATDADIRATDYSREDNYGIGLYGCRRFTFRGVHIRNVWGDGFYWARGDDLDAATLSDTLLWEDCDVITSGRNGWSHVTGRNITLRRCLARAVALHGFDVEPNRSDDETVNLLLEDFGAFDFDAALSPAGPGYSVVVGPGPPSNAANGVTLRRTRMDRPRLYIVGPSSGDKHQNVTVTGSRSAVAGSAIVEHVDGWVASDNDNLSTPPSGTVT